MRHLYSMLGLVIGFLAVGIAAFETHLNAAEPPKQDTRTLRELASEASKRVLKEKVLKEEPVAPAPPAKAFPPSRIAYTLLGLAAMGLGIVSWIRKEHIRMSGGAAALGLLAVCWPWAIIGVVIAVALFAYANLSA